MAHTRLDTRLKRLEARYRPSEHVAYVLPEVSEEFVAEVWQLLQTYGWYTSWEEWYVAWHDAVYGKEVCNDVAE
jgi:hypothetical protein